MVKTHNKFEILMELKNLIEKTAELLSEQTEKLKEFEMEFSVIEINGKLSVDTKDVRVRIKANIKNKKGEGVKQIPVRWS